MHEKFIVVKEHGSTRTFLQWNLCITSCCHKSNCNGGCAYANSFSITLFCLASHANEVLTPKVFVTEKTRFATAFCRCKNVFFLVVCHLYMEHLKSFVCFVEFQEFSQLKCQCQCKLNEFSKFHLSR